MRSLKSEDKAGLYITVIVHLTVIIILLVSQIVPALKKDNSFVIDFSREEAIEKLEEEERERLAEEAFDEEIGRRIEDLLNGTSGAEFRNVAVDRSSALKDDRGTDADQLYKDAERLAGELKDGFEIDEPDEDYAEVAPKDNKEKEEEKEYSGPSVVSYQLDGRKASRLPIPAYRCMGGGMVTVIITVDNAGNVLTAKVQDEVSSDDRCLREFAVRAARLSRFSADPKAPARQGGNIVYQFIRQ